MKLLTSFPTSFMVVGQTAKWVMIATPVLVIGIVLSLYLPDRLRNSRKLEELKSAVEAVPPPSETERLFTRTAVGLLVGKGSQCDFFVGTLYRSASTPNSVHEHYAARIFLNPITGNEEQVSLNILTNRESWKAVALPPKLASPEAWGISNGPLPTGTVFLVTVMRSYAADRDCRCQ